MANEKHAVHYEKVPMHGSRKGGFQLPDDVIAKLGNGDRETGLTVADQLFGHHLDYGRGPVHPNIVRYIGGDDGDALATGHKVLQRFVEKIRGTEGGSEHHGAIKVAKAEAGYREHGTTTQHCSICTMFESSDNSCTLVKGKISPDGWCRYFESKR